MRLQISIVGALTLVIGFSVAVASGRVWLGGVVLCVGGAYCAWRSWALSGWRRTLIILGIFVVAMVASHPGGALLDRLVGEPAGGWISAVAAALIAGTLCWAISRPAPVGEGGH